MGGSLDKLMDDFFRRGIVNRPTQIGVFSSASASRAVKVSTSITAAWRVYADDGGAVIWKSGSVSDKRVSLSRFLLTKDNTGGFVRAFGSMGHVKAYDAKWNNEMVGGIYGYLEIVRSAATLTLGGYGVSAGVMSMVETSGAVTVNTYHMLAGVAAISSFKATQTQTGTVPAFLAAAYDTTNWSDSTARGTTWTHALYVKNAGAAFGFLSGTAYEAGVKIASCATALTGTNAAGTTTVWDGVVKITIAGTAYYIPFMAAGNITGE